MGRVTSVIIFEKGEKLPLLCCSYLTTCLRRYRESDEQIQSREEEEGAFSPRRDDHDGHYDDYRDEKEDRRMFRDDYRYVR